jgi:alkylhydroperoxidase/carboxymuconolactone decarboxylase family protein YurZ
MTTTDSNADEILARLTRDRGDTFKEFGLLARYLPRELDALRKAAGYVHHYEGHARPSQSLSVQMRELLALTLLASKGDDRFATNHVRRLYRLGVADAVILDAASAATTVIGWSTVAHVALCIEEANNPSYPFGEMPASGRPTETQPFPELELVATDSPATDASYASGPDWEYMAEVDPTLVELVREYAELTSLSGGVRAQPGRLGPGPRELVTIALLCGRGMEERAVQHIQRARRLGMSRLQVMEAISTGLPMYGVIALEIGARALRQAEESL